MIRKPIDNDVQVFLCSQTHGTICNNLRKHRLPTKINQSGYQRKSTINFESN